MKIEMKVDWGIAANRQTMAKPMEAPRSRADGRLWYIALAREIKSGIASGYFSSLADAARKCDVSRARLSQIVD